MRAAQLPDNEIARLAALHDLEVLDTSPEAEFDALVRVAAMVCGVPISLISLIDTERQWFKANTGLPGVTETPRDAAFCAHAILDDGIFEVPDTLLDPRFFDNPLVTGNPDIRFYAGAPVRLNDGNRVGTLCVIDRKPRQLDEGQREILRNLAVSAAHALDGRRAMRKAIQISADLAASEARLRALSDGSPLGIYHATLAGEFTYTNQRWQDIHGLSPQGSLGFEWVRLIHPQDRERIKAAMQPLSEAQHALDLEYRIVTADKRIHHLMMRARPIADTQGIATGYVGSVEDITERKEQEIALRKSKGLLDRTGRLAGVGGWEVDLLAGEIRWADETCLIHGVPPGHRPSMEEAIGFYAPQARPVITAAVELAVAGGPGFDLELPFVRAGGEEIWVRAVGTVEFENGTPVRLIGAFQDVTQRVVEQIALKEARNAAEDATRSKGQFLANMSHEIRTPMNAILGMLSLLQKTDLSPRQYDYATKTEVAAKSLLGLLNDILDFSKVEAGKLGLDVQPFRIEQLMQDLSVVLSANVGSKDVEVLFDIDPDIPDMILGDSMRLQQVLINLGGNAVKFTEKGQVVISLRRKAMDAHQVSIEFSVQDSGIGIQAQHQAHIFSGFSQAEASTTRRFGGTGLGLAICQRLVSLMGGQIQLSSTPGQGSNFFFALDFPVAQNVTQDFRDTYRNTSSTRHVLVVDDNPVAGEIMLQMARSCGWTAELASSGAQALAMVRANTHNNVFPYQVVYLDWHMPEMDGWETARRIRQASKSMDGPKPMLVMVTAHNQETLSQRTEEEQNLLDGFLVKPVTASVMHDAVVNTETALSRLRHAKRATSSLRQLNGMRILVVEDNLINQQVAEELLNAEGALVSLAANGKLGVEAVAAAQPQFHAVLMDLQMPVLDGYRATAAIRNELHLKTLPIIAMTANALESDREACLKAGMDEHVGKPFDMAHLVSVLIRTTGFEAPVSNVLMLPTDTVDEASIPQLPGLDVALALSRLSGLKSLYIRTARDFSQALEVAVPEFRLVLQAGAMDRALMQMHTLKGNAGTLGANLLAAEAGRIERLCKPPADLDMCLAQVDGLDALARSTRLLLEEAIALLEGEPPVARQAIATPNALARQAALAALGELARLLEASDMQAMDNFAQAQPLLVHLPEPLLAALEESIQTLDFESALARLGDLVHALETGDEAQTST